MRARPVSLGVAMVGLMLLLTTVAFAASGYSVRVKAPSSVGRQQAFTITASGSAKTKSGLVLFLSNQSCKSTYLLEYNTIGARKPEQPYFQRGPRVGSRSNASATYNVNGSFHITAAAYTGRNGGIKYVCAYIPARGHTKTRAHGSTKFTVK